MEEIIDKVLTIFGIASLCIMIILVIVYFYGIRHLAYLKFIQDLPAEEWNSVEYSKNYKDYMNKKAEGDRYVDRHAYNTMKSIIIQVNKDKEKEVE